MRPTHMIRSSLLLLLATPGSRLTAQIGLVADIYPGLQNANPVGLTELGGKLVFAANDGVHGFEPWVTDGTPGGTMMLADIWPGAASGIWNADPQFGQTNEFATVRRGNQLWFFADSGLGETELWVTDGTPAGTNFVQRFDVPAQSYYSGWQMRGTLARGEVMFLAYTQGGPGWRIWRTDLASGGIVPVQSIGTHMNYRYCSAVTAEAKAFFVVDNFFGASLWSSDGTNTGTAQLAYLGASGQLYAVAAAGDRVVFGWQGASGNELGSSDGTPAGTAMVADIYPGAPSSTPHGFAPFGRFALFAADDGVHGVEPWITDGTAAGTALLVDAAPGSGGSDPLDFVAQHHRAWFATHIAGEQLWLTDGTTAGTTQVAGFQPPLNPWSEPGFTPAGSRRMFFRGTGSPGYYEPWASDGTAAGTGLLQALGGFGSSAPSRGVLAGGAVYFSATDYIATGRELYRWFPGASSQLVGDGLGSSGPAPRLFATDPVLGGAITFDGDAQPNAYGIVAVGLPAKPSGSFFTADLWVSLPAAVLLPVPANALGRWSIPPINLPNLPGLTGVRLAAQGLFTLGGPIDVSNGAMLTFGY